MYTVIAIFYISLIGMAILVLCKRHESKTGRPSVLSRLGKGTDHVFQAASASVRRTLSYANKKTLIVLAQWIAYHVLLRTRNVYVEIKHQALQNPHSRKVIDAVRGRGEIRDHGASFYLRRISSEK